MTFLMTQTSSAASCLAMSDSAVEGDPPRLQAVGPRSDEDDAEGRLVAFFSHCTGIIIILKDARPNIKTAPTTVARTEASGNIVSGPK